MCIMMSAVSLFTPGGNEMMGSTVTQFNYGYDMLPVLVRQLLDAFHYFLSFEKMVHFLHGIISIIR